MWLPAKKHTLQHRSVAFYIGLHGAADVRRDEQWRHNPDKNFLNILNVDCHLFIYFAINQKYNNSIQKYIKDNIQYSY